MISSSVRILRFFRCQITAIKVFQFRLSVLANINANDENEMNFMKNMQGMDTPKGYLMKRMIIIFGMSLTLSPMKKS